MADDGAAAPATEEEPAKPRAKRERKTVERMTMEVKEEVKLEAAEGAGTKLDEIEAVKEKVGDWDSARHAAFVSCPGSLTFIDPPAFAAGRDVEERRETQKVPPAHFRQGRQEERAQSQHPPIFGAGLLRQGRR